MLLIYDYLLETPLGSSSDFNHLHINKIIEINEKCEMWDIYMYVGEDI